MAHAFVLAIVALLLLGLYFIQKHPPSPSGLL